MYYQKKKQLIFQEKSDMLIVMYHTAILVLLGNLCKGKSWKNITVIKDVICVREDVGHSAAKRKKEPVMSQIALKSQGRHFIFGRSLVFPERKVQNREIAQGEAGKEVCDERLAEIFLELGEKGANNINLVTPGQYVPHIICAVEQARAQGLRIPIIYNTSSYESVETIKRLEGIVDIYLPDFKYWNHLYSMKYSKAPDYRERAAEAIAEMVRQQPEASFYLEEPDSLKKNFAAEAEDGYLMRKGVIVRQLLLPGLLSDAKKILAYLYETYGNQIYYSLMNQYTPLSHVQDYPELNRKVSKEEYEAYIDYALWLGIAHGFLQEGETAEESFIPAFDGEGV